MSELSEQEVLVSAFEGCLNAFESALTDNATCEMMNHLLTFLKELEVTYRITCLKESIEIALVDTLEMKQTMEE